MAPGCLQLCIAGPDIRQHHANNRLISGCIETLGKVEPTYLLTSQDGGLVKLDRGEQNAAKEGPLNDSLKKFSSGGLRKKSTKRGLRKRLTSLAKTRSGCKIEINLEEERLPEETETTEEESSEHSDRITTSERSSRSNDTQDDDSAGGKKHSADLEVRRPSRSKSIQFGVAGVKSAANQDSRHKASCLIQAFFRGFVSRMATKEKLLLKKLQAIEKMKKDDMTRIETKKQTGMDVFRAVIEGKARRRARSWYRKSDAITTVMTEVQSSREINNKLKMELVELKKENNALVLLNTMISMSAANEERRLNSLERCGLQLHDVARNYKEVLSKGEEMLRDLDDEFKGLNDDDTSDTSSHRLSEIKKMIELAEEEDEQLIQLQ